MNRRSFLAAVAAIDPDDLLKPARTYFLPPSGGWVKQGSLWLRRGDIVTFEGVFAVDPVTQRSTGRLQDFVVTFSN